MENSSSSSSSSSGSSDDLLAVINTALSSQFHLSVRLPMNIKEVRLSQVQCWSQALISLQATSSRMKLRFISLLSICAYFILKDTINKKNSFVPRKEKIAEFRAIIFDQLLGDPFFKFKQEYFSLGWFLVEVLNHSSDIPSVFVSFFRNNWERLTLSEVLKFAHGFSGVFSEFPERGNFFDLLQCLDGFFAPLFETDFFRSMAKEDQSIIHIQPSLTHSLSQFGIREFINQKNNFVPPINQHSPISIPKNNNSTHLTLRKRPNETAVTNSPVQISERPKRNVKQIESPEPFSAQIEPPRTSRKRNSSPAAFRYKRIDFMSINLSSNPPKISYCVEWDPVMDRKFPRGSKFPVNWVSPDKFNDHKMPKEFLEKAVVELWRHIQTIDKNFRPSSIDSRNFPPENSAAASIENENKNEN